MTQELKQNTQHHADHSVVILTRGEAEKLKRFVSLVKEKIDQAAVVDLIDDYKKDAKEALAIIGGRL